jgi:alpha-L-fucosidase
MKKIGLFLLLIFTLALAQAQPLPHSRQIAWQQWETTAFLHFTVNTFTDKEWGDGTEAPSVFNPTNFNAREIVKTLKETGFKLVLLTAKHHDGFCLWPTKMTEHCVRNSPYKNGKGDIVGEIAAACKEFGLKFGVYLSPWDRHEPSYGTNGYNDFYKSQLRELLTQYGDINEVWFDGAKGENAKNMAYDFKGIWDIVRQLQPKAVMFSDAGPDIRWVGNESGNAGETCWSTLTITDENKLAEKGKWTGKAVAPGKADENYLNTGDKNGTSWIPAETDVSIRPGWFFHEKENDKVRTPQNLLNLYYKSVGRNSLLLLNIPPDRRGMLHENDVASLREFRSILDETFKTNLAAGKVKKKLLDKKIATDTPLSISKPFVVNFKKNETFDRAMFQENILKGQRIEKAQLEYWDGTNWQLIQEFTTIGYKRLLRFPIITSNKIRFTVLEAKTPKVFLSDIGVFKASSRE